MKEMTVDATIENLNSVLDFIETEIENNNVPKEIHNNIKITAEEIFVNIAYYAYTPSTGSVNIKIDAGSEFIMEFKDSGTKYNPLEKDDPNITAPIEERDIGGLGVFLLKQLMDKIEYRYENGYNILTVKKKV